MQHQIDGRAERELDGDILGEALAIVITDIAPKHLDAVDEQDRARAVPTTGVRLVQVNRDVRGARDIADPATDRWLLLGILARMTTPPREVRLRELGAIVLVVRRTPDLAVDRERREVAQRVGGVGIL